MTRRRGRIAAGIVVILVGAWLAVGLLPRFADGDMTRYDAETYPPDDEDPFDLIDKSLVVDPSDGTYDGLFTFENTGIAPVTVRAGAFPDTVYSYGATIVAMDQRTYEHLGTRDAFTVPAGGLFAVEVTFGLGCAHMAAGSSTWISEVPVRATTLGLTRTVDLTLPEPIGVGVTEDRVPPAHCEQDG